MAVESGITAAAGKGRPEQPEPFLRGCAWKAGAGATYPRADPADMPRLAVDTWGTACIPATVRLEFVGSATAVRIEYRTTTDDMGYRGDGAGRTFTLWQGESLVDSADAVLGEGSVELAAGSGDAPRIVYLPEGMKPVVTSITGVGGDIEPAPPQPRWVAYGDSLLEGWIASGPAGAWPAIAGRRHGLDVVNMGYAGAARGEVASAEQLAKLTADVISITHGTNCWTRTPHSVGQMRENTLAFLAIVRDGHPGTPIVVASPVVRPDAEATPNRLGATLADLRAAMEQAVESVIAAGDGKITLIRGLPVLPADQLADGIHPGDAGHQTLAAAFGPPIAAALTRS